MMGERRHRILIVEDQGMISMMLEDMVLDLGYDIVGPAARLDQALKLALESDIDVGLLDINVDGMVIFPVADVLRFRGIPFVFSTGYNKQVLPERFRGCPALLKPFSQRDLADKLKSQIASTLPVDRMTVPNF